MMSTVDLADFLLARIAEDEESIKQRGDWWMPMWTRKRAIAECEAKRRIVQRWKEAAAVLKGELSDDDPQDDGTYTAQASFDEMDAVLRLLALPYADHPDYRPEWRP